MKAFSRAAVVTVPMAFVAGFLAVLVFHQGAWAILHAVQMVPAGQPAWSLAPVPPFGVPKVISLAFWGGVWAVLLAMLLPEAHGFAFWSQWVLTGAIVLTLVALYVVVPLKGGPLTPFTWPRFAIGALVNGAWGLGTAAFLRIGLALVDRTGRR